MQTRLSAHQSVRTILVILQYSFLYIFYTFSCIWIVWIKYGDDVDANMIRLIIMAVLYMNQKLLCASSWMYWIIEETVWKKRLIKF